MQFYKVWNSVLETNELEIAQFVYDTPCHLENKR